MKIILSKKFYLPLFFLINVFGVISYTYDYFNFDSFTFSIISSILLFIFILSEKFFGFKRGDNLFEPDFIFVFIFIIFHFSYIWLYFFGISDFDNEVFYNQQKVPLAIYFCSLCIILFEISYGESSGYLLKNKVKNSNSVLFKIHKFSKLLLVFCVFCFWVPFFSVGLSIFQNYSDLISIGKLSYFGKLYWVGQYLAICAISLYCLSSGFLFGRFMAGHFRFLAIFYILGFLLIGDRGTFVFLAIIPAISYSIFQKRVSIKIFTFAVAFLLIISSFVAVSRTQSIFNPMDAVTNYYEKESKSPIIRALNEYGSSLKTVVIVMHLVPSLYDYWYGKSYLNSLFLVVPNLFGEKRSSENSPGSWLTETVFGPLDQTHGRGGSIAMEAYLNFGFWFGSLFFFFLGRIVKISYRSFLHYPSVINGSLYFSLMSVLVLWMRNTSSVAFRTIIWTMLITFIVQKIRFNINFYKK
jgi:oligosaccharide repeat unit polymerase